MKTSLTDKLAHVLATVRPRLSQEEQKLAMDFVLVFEEWSKLMREEQKTLLFGTLLFRAMTDLKAKGGEIPE